MSTPLFCAYSATYIKDVDLPHIYDQDRLSPHGYNGAPARVLVAVPPKAPNLHQRREGRRGTDDIDPTKATLEKVEVFLYAVPVLMPFGYWRTLEVAVTTNPDLGARLPSAPTSTPPESTAPASPTSTSVTGA